MKEVFVKRFWAKVKKGEKLFDCWIWTGAVGSPNRNGICRYGNFAVEGKSFLVHRFVWELMNGPIPENQYIDHLCRVTTCVNPAHLELVSLRENVLRGTGHSAVNARKTHCIRGHKFDEENTLHEIRASNGRPRRRCRKCRKLYGRTR